MILEIIIFELKNDGKKWSRNYFEIHQAPSEILANLPGQFSPNGQIFGTGQQQLWRGSVNFKINSRPLFTIIFKLKNDNFKTRDFSPLIKRVITGVLYVKVKIIDFHEKMSTKSSTFRIRMYWSGQVCWTWHVCTIVGKKEKRVATLKSNDSFFVS